MRTRTLLLAVAALAAGLVTSQAQVYSQNIVGYINITLKPGYNLIANQLVNGTNGLMQVFPTMPDQTVIYKWNFATQGFQPADTYFAPDGWFDGSFQPSVKTVSPGEGVFVQNNSGSAQTITLTGQVTTGNNLTVNIQGPGYGFYSSIVPDGASFTSAGFPQVDQMIYQGFNPTGNTYTSALTYFAPDGWYNTSFVAQTPTPAVGEGFLIYNPSSSVSWTRNFNP